MRAITSPDSPAPVAPYSLGIDTGSLVFLSGQVGLDATTGRLVEGCRAQAELALRNIDGLLRAADLSFANVIKVTIFLSDISDYAEINEVYGAFVQQPPPARSTVGVAALPLGARVEIEVIASRDS
jgi:2-iminobutanoate/2-iminopropanoate deaminase